MKVICANFKILGALLMQNALQTGSLLPHILPIELWQCPPQEFYIPPLFYSVYINLILRWTGREALQFVTIAVHCHAHWCRKQDIIELAKLSRHKVPQKGLGPRPT